MTRRSLAFGAAGVVACVTVAAAAGPPPSQLAAIGGLPRLPAGPPGKISIVAQGRYGSYSPGTILPLVVRNGTGRPVTGVHVAGPALDSKGRVIAEGQDDGVQPIVVPPGGLAIGFVRFGGRNLPAGTRFKLVVTDTPPAAVVGFSKQVDLSITAARYVRGHLVGSAKNTTRKRVSRPIVALAACFDRSNGLVTFAKAFGKKSSAAAGQSVAFDIDFTRHGARAAPVCAHVLTSMTSFTPL